MNDILIERANSLNTHLECLRLKNEALQREKESLSCELKQARGMLATAVSILADLNESFRPTSNILERAEGCINHAWPHIEAANPQDLAPSTYHG